MKKIKLFVGTISQRSSSLSIGKYFVETFKDRFEIELVDLDLPLYNGDVDNDQYRPKAIARFYEVIADADGYVMITPEYNSSISSVLKNAIDWASRSADFCHKPALMVANSMGKTGGARAFMHLNDILHRVPMCVLSGHDILISESRSLFNDAGVMQDVQTVGFLEGAMNAFEQFIEKMAD